MKNTTFITAVLLLFTSIIIAQQTYVPDDNFENYLETHDANGNTVPIGDPSSMGNGIANDDYVTTSKINTVTTLYVNTLSIADLTGIEDFAALTLLNCSFNQLTTLDVTQNTNLFNLDCSGNQIQGLDVTQNISLFYLACNQNQISNLDISQNTALSSLYCDNNQLSSLDASQNTALTIFRCYSNQFTNLNIKNGNNTNLNLFDAQYNPNLTCVEVDDPVYMNANWSNAIDATATYSTHCPLGETYVPDDNFENYLETHDAFGYMTSIGSPNSMGNGIANDDYVTTSRINTVTTLDVNTNAIADLTGIEDFTALQILKCSQNQLTNLDISQNTALLRLYCFYNQLTSLDVSQNTALQKLRVGDNQLTSLDVSQNTALQELTCYNNQLTNLDISQNVALQVFNCSDNQLTSIDVSQNIALQEFGCLDNQLTSIDVSQNVALQILYCSANQLTNLDLSQNTALYSLYCDNNNQLTSLDMRNGNNSNFNYFNATNNPNLTCVYVDDKAYMNANWANAIDTTATYVETQAECDALAQTYTPDDNFENYLETHDANGYTVPIGDPSSMGNGIANDDYVTTSRINTVTNLDVAYLSIADLTGIEDFTALTNLSCHHNNLTALDVTQNTSLTELYCSINQIANLDVTQNTALTKLYCYNNQLSNLDVSLNTSLTDLRCYNNQLTGLDVTANVAIQILEFGNNTISNIDLTQNIALQSLDCGYNQLTGLDVSQNTVLQAVACNNNQLTSLDIRNGNNANLYNFTAIGNPNLTCVFVDDKTYMNANWTNAIDATATYVETQTECNTLAVSNSILEQAITIYPIPAKERLTVKSGINGKYKMYDYTGKRILKGSILIGENSIPLQQCSKGIYFMEIIANKTSIIKKIVVE